MRISTSELLRTAYSEYSIGAFNVCNMEQILGLFRSGTNAQAPFMVAFSRAALAYAGPLMLNGMIKAAAEIYPNAIFAVHLDHGDESACYRAIDLGLFSSVMIDASYFPFEENIAISRRVVDAAHPRGLSVEAELGAVAGVEDDIRVEEQDHLLTDPAMAREFVGRVGCDSLAVAVGTRHGAYKFKNSNGMQLDRLEAVQRALPGFPLVLHGASAVPAAEVQRINSAGGRIDVDARGVDDSRLSLLAALGVVKVNVATDARLIWARVHREFFRDHPEAFDLCTPGLTYMHAFAKFAADKFSALGSTGHVEDFRELANRAVPRE